VSVVARRDETVLEVEVADDGVGFRVRSGRGVGLANIRARLQSLFGASGSLDLAGRHEGGVIATLRLPLRQTADPVAA
jgi:LytS/YehU family sensor histidine kinase